MQRPKANSGSRGSRSRRYCSMASGHCLLGQAVLQFEACNRQAADEYPHVQRPHRFVTAVAQLAGDGEAVQRMQRGGLVVAGARCGEKQRDVVGAMLDTVAQNVDCAALADLGGKARKKGPPHRRIVGQIEGIVQLRLCGAQKGNKLGQIYAPLAVVVFRAAVQPARAAVCRRRLAGRRCKRLRPGAPGHRRDDQTFKPLFAGVRAHPSPPINDPSTKSPSPICCFY